jgi:hypothetical protein
MLGKWWLVVARSVSQAESRKLRSIMAPELARVRATCVLAVNSPTPACSCSDCGLCFCLTLVAPAFVVAYPIGAKVGVASNAKQLFGPAELYGNDFPG